MQCFVGLGGNLGFVPDTMRAAIDDLNDFPGLSVAAVSSFFETAPMGPSAGTAYVNAALELRAELSPFEVLDSLHAVETRHGRTRETRWGPRTLDLDLLLYGGEVSADPRLILPHPGCWYRRFVLDPLAEIAPDVVHPVKGLPISELRERLLPRPLAVGIAGGRRASRDALRESLCPWTSEAAFSIWNAEDCAPAMLLWLGASEHSGTDFASLPLLPRLDLTTFPEDPAAAAKNVLTAALGN